MEFTIKDPDKGYVGTSLLLPKKYINEQALKASLTFILKEREKIFDTNTQEFLGDKPRELKLWDETEHHLIVPRELFPRKQWSKLGFELVDERPLQFPKAGIKARSKPLPEQDVGMKSLSEADGGTFNMRCGGGKTVLALLNAAKHDVPTLIVVNSTALLEQWLKEIDKHLDVPAKDVGVIQGDQVNWRGKAIVLATIQTLAARPELRCAEFREYFGLVYYDEGHHMSAPVFVLGADLVAGMRFTLTATASRTDGLENVYQYHLGRVFFQDLEQDLIPTTIFHMLDWVVPPADEDLMRDKTGVTNISRLRGYLGTVQKRNDFIQDQIRMDMEAGRVILVLSHSVPHVQDLFAGCQYKGSGIIIGDTEQNMRMPMLKNSNPLFGTFQLAREGLDKPPLDTLHICTLFGNPNDLQQSWGRIQRTLDGKQPPIVHVYVDKNISACVKSGLQLQKFLRALDYPFEIRKETL